MAYATLTAGAGYMQRRAVLDADAQAWAEQSATDYVDTEFAGWLRTAWTGAGIPTEIGRIALKWATSEYLDQVFEGRREDRTDTRIARLKREASEEAARVKGLGGPLLSDGTRQAMLTTASPDNGRTIDIVNG